MANQMIGIGLGNSIVAKRVVAVLNPLSSAMRRLKEEAKAEGRLVDAKQGKKARSYIVTDSNHLILSSVSPETLIKRLDAIGKGEEE